MGASNEETNLLPEVLKAVAGPVVSTVGTIATGVLGRSWSNEDWKDQTRILNDQAIANAKNSPLYTVEGLRKAGLNPALAAGGNYSSVPVQSAPMQSHSMPVTPIDLSQIELTKASAKLAEANANKASAEATKLDFENAEKSQEQDAADAFIRQQLNSVIAKDPKSPDAMAAQNLLAINQTFNLGTARGMESAKRFEELLSTVDKVKVANEFEKLVFEEKKKADAPKFLAQMDAWQIRRFAMDFTEAQQRIMSMGIENELKNKEIERVVAETASILKDIGLRDYESFAHNWETGHHYRASLILLDKALTAAAGMAPMLVPGSAAAKLGRKAARTTENAFKRLNGIPTQDQMPKLMLKPVPASH